MNSSQNVQWTPATAPPDWLEKHENALWSSDERYLLMKGCKNCQTTLKDHICKTVGPVDYVVFDRERGINQNRIDALIANAQKALTTSPENTVAAAPVPRPQTEINNAPGRDITKSTDAPGVDITPTRETAIAVAETDDAPAAAQADAPIKEIIKKAADLFAEKKTDEEIKTILCKEYELPEDELDVILEAGEMVKHAEDEVFQAQQAEDETRQAAMDAKDKELAAKFEADKQFLENYCLKNFKKMPVSKEDIEKYAKLYREQAAAAIVAPPKFKNSAYPVFPRFVMEGTSIYENFVKPICAVNCRIPEFMWVPATAMMLNYLGNKVSIWGKNFKPSFYVVLVGERGRAIKSASVEDSMAYLNYAGVLLHGSQDLKNAEGRIVVFTSGSTEGLGLEMQKTNCKNAVLFFDEFKTLAVKAGIEGSSTGPHLLTLYESGKFANKVKSSRETFSFDPGTYCMTLLACNTQKNFGENWGRFANQSVGMEDRFTFILQPETLPELTVVQYINTLGGAAKTRALIDKAVLKSVYHITDQGPLQKCAELYGNRAEIRAEKWALAFAVDLGRDEIDADCVQRGIAMAKYEHEVKQYLMPRDAETKMAGWQQQAVRVLQNQPRGRMPLLGKKGFLVALDAPRFDTETWNRLYMGLIKNGWIREEGKGIKSDPTYIQLMKTFDSDGGE